MMTKRTMNNLAIATAMMSIGESAKAATNYINSQGELMLYGIIGDWWDGNDAMSVVAQLEQAKPVGDLHVRIHSEGGNILDGLAIYNALKQSDRKVVVTIDGMALSMATIIALAGDEVRMPRNAFQFLHLAMNEVRGNSDDLRKAAEQLEQFSEQAAGIYAEHSNLSKEEALELMRNETWLNAEQCLKHGLIDVILDPVEAVAHHLNSSEFPSTPEGVSAFMQLPIAAPAAQDDENPEEENDVLKSSMKKPQMNAGQNAGQNPQPAGAPAPTPAEKAAMVKEGVAAERKRISDLTMLAQTHGIADSVLKGWIDDETTLADANTAALAELAKRDKENMPAGRVRTVNSGSTLREDVAAAVMHRIDPTNNKLEGANDFAHMSLIDICRSVLSYNGISVSGMTPQQIAGAVLHSTSDLPNVFADVASNQLARGYASRPRTFTSIATRRTLPNFKPQNMTRLSDAPMLLDKLENGEYQLGHLEDSKETIALSTKGRIIRISREMLINDDLDALSRLPMMMGAQAVQAEIRAVYGLLTSNPTMGETGKSLFHADHKNLLTGAGSAFSVDNLGAMRKLLRKQKSKGAKGEAGYPLNTPLQTILVPAALETEADKIRASIVAAKVADVNPFPNLQIITEAELDDVSETAYYGFGDPMLVDGLVFGYLEGQEGAYIDSQFDFKSDGFDLKVRHDFAASVADYRGIGKANGA